MIPIRVLLDIIPVGLYLLVGFISFIMAGKNLCAEKFIPFQEKAAGKSWENIDAGLQPVIIALMRVSGLGFLVVALLLTVFPLVNFFRPDRFVQLAIPLISLLYCFGLFLINYGLYKRTKAATPWKGSLFAVFIIALGLVISNL